ncbi:MAG TPA: AAA family ATPase [Anaerolineales bacterium]|nr:AAA family ATPase [Anaerolineales bacterium]
MSDKQPTRVMLIGKTGPIQEQIATALATNPDFVLAEVLANIERISIEITTIEPDIILIDSEVTERNIHEVVDDLSLQFPALSTIVLLSDDNAVTTQQVMLAGARAFIIKPFTQVNLVNTLNRVSTLEAARKRVRPLPGPQVEQTEGPVQTVAVFSPKGGVGCSTIATNLAIAHYQDRGGRVLLMDGKLFFGHLDVSLNILTGNSIADLIPHATNIDEGLINDVVHKHSSGIHVLMAPRSLQVAEGIRADNLFSILKALQRSFDFIVIDVGSNLNENSITLLDSADRIILVTAPDLTTLHDTSQFIQLSPSLSIPVNKLLIVVNREGMTGGVRTKDIEAALRHEIFGRIPDDEPNAVRSINRGVPLLLRYPRSPASKAIRQLSNSMAGMSQVEILGLNPAREGADG